jgi:hypothetical protein
MNGDKYAMKGMQRWRHDGRKLSTVVRLRTTAHKSRTRSTPGAAQMNTIMDTKIGRALNKTPAQRRNRPPKPDKWRWSALKTSTSLVSNEARPKEIARHIRYVK